VNLAVAAHWRNEAPGGLWFFSDTRLWHFELRRDSTGWRILDTQAAVMVRHVVREMRGTLAQPRPSFIVAHR